MSVTAFKIKNVPPPGKKRVGDWLNMRVRTKCEMANGYATIPAGSLATVTGTGNGLWLKIDPCAHCGISVNIARVHGSDVEPIDSGVSEAVA